MLCIATAATFLSLKATLGVLFIALIEVIALYYGSGYSVAKFLSESPFVFLVTITLVMIAFAIHREQLSRTRCKALAESEQRLRTLIEQLPVMVDVVDQNSTIQLWNKACERITGYSAAEIVGDPSAFERLYPDREYREAMYQQYRLKPNLQNAVYRLTCKDGSSRLIAWSTVDFTAADPAWHELSVGVDVTEQYQRERELSAIASIATALRSTETYAEMAALILDQIIALMDAQAASLAVLGQDAEGRYLVVKSARGIWESHLAEPICLRRGLYMHVIETQRPYVTADAYHDPYMARPQRLNGLSAVAAVPLIVQERVFGVIGMGRRTPFSEEDVRVLTAICDIAANALQRAETLQQLEERVQERTAQLQEAYQRLETLDQLKTKLIADLSHELRTPISTLSVQMHLIESNFAHPQVPERLRVMKTQIGRLNQLIEGVLDLLRLEMQRDSVPMQPQDINLLLSQLIAKFQRQLAPEQHFEAQVAPNLPKVRGNFTLLSRAVENVLDNALKYTAQGTIRLCASQQNSCITITISDTGIGIPPEDMPHIFERFYRGKLVGQSNIAGIGLGLTIAQAIFELHDGTIQLHSTPRVGTQVQLTLPALN